MRFSQKRRWRSAILKIIKSPDLNKKSSNFDAFAIQMQIWNFLKSFFGRNAAADYCISVTFCTGKQSGIATDNKNSNFKNSRPYCKS